MLHDQAVAILASVEEAKNRVSESFQEGGTVTVGCHPHRRSLPSTAHRRSIQKRDS